MRERIDLTQFDAITKGDWELIDTPNGGIDIGVRQAGGHNPVVTFTQSMGAQVRNIPRDVADMNAIAAVPRLIAELKTCYEAVDVLSSSIIEDVKMSMNLAQKLEKQNRDIEEIIDCLDGVDSIFGEEIIGMLRPLLVRLQ